MFRIDNLFNWVKSLVGIKKNDAEAVERGLENSAYQVLYLAAYYCPVEKGNLKRSGRVEKDGAGFDARFVVAFGSDLAFYAIYVHEDLTANHASPTCAKFLERAIRERAGKTGRMVQETMVNGPRGTLPIAEAAISR